MKRMLLKVTNTIISLIIGGIIGYFTNYNAAVDATNVKNATQFVDYQTNRDGVWSTTSPVDDIQFDYKDKKGRKIDNLNRFTTELYNFGTRNLPAFSIQIDARAKDGKLPTLIGRPAVSTGDSHDFSAEGSVEQYVRGGTLSIVVNFSGLNQTERYNAERKIVLFFAGNTAPDLTVSARGNGVNARPQAFAHYAEREATKVSWFIRHQIAILTAAYAVLSIALLSAATFFNRRRARRRFRILPDVITNQLALTGYEKISNDQKKSISVQIAFSVWNSLYDGLPWIDRLIGQKPDIEILTDTSSTN